MLTACALTLALSLSLHSHGSWRRTVLLLPLPLPLQQLLLRFCFVLFWFFVVDFRQSANSPVLQSVYTCLFLSSLLFGCSFIGMGVVVVLFILFSVAVVVAVAVYSVRFVVAAAVLCTTKQGEIIQRRK